MSNPYAAVDTVVVDQFRNFTDLTSVIASNRINFQERRVDTRQINELGDSHYAMWVTTSLSPENLFTSTDSNDTELVYEITILRGGHAKADIRQIQWHIARACTRLAQMEDASGNSLSSSNPDPLKWAGASLTQFTNVDDGNVLRSTATLRVRLIGDPDAIITDTATTPLPTAAYYLTKAAQIKVLFDKKIAQTNDAVTVDYDVTHWLPCLTGDGNPASPSLLRLIGNVGASGRNNEVTLTITSTGAGCGTGVHSIPYTGTHLVGANGVTVAAFTLTENITVIDT